MQRDQSEEVYRWTYDLFPMAEQPIMTLADAQYLVQHVWFFYRGADPAPLVVDIPNRSESATGSRWAIRLPTWARRKPLILHEVAHSLSIDGDSNRCIHDDYNYHGPLYVALVMDLYSMFLGTSRDHMRERADYFGVSIAEG